MVTKLIFKVGPAFSEVQQTLGRIDDQLPAREVDPTDDGAQERNVDRPGIALNLQEICRTELVYLGDPSHFLPGHGLHSHTQELVIEHLPVLQALQLLPGPEEVASLETLGPVPVLDTLESDEIPRRKGRTASTLRLGRAGSGAFPVSSPRYRITPGAKVPSG